MHVTVLTRASKRLVHLVI